jgi:hypothetical protein
LPESLVLGGPVSHPQKSIKQTLPRSPYLAGSFMLSDIRVKVCAYGEAAKQQTSKMLPDASASPLFWKAHDSLHPTTSEKGIPWARCLRCRPALDNVGFVRPKALPEHRVSPPALHTTAAAVELIRI